MSSEEKVQELQGLLSRAEAINQMLKDSFESFDTAKSGNGWTADILEEKKFTFKPVPLQAALTAAEEKKTAPFGMLGGFFGKPKPEDVKLVDKTLWYYPYWVVEGTHSIFYFRSANYRVPVQDDVLGTIVEGKARSLISEEKTTIGKIVPSKGFLQRFIQPRTRHFTIAEVTEFAYTIKSGSVYLDHSGNESGEFEGLMESSPPVVEVKDPEGLKVKGIKTSVSETAGGKDLVLRRLHDKIVTKPNALDRVWNNILEIKRLELYYKPVYRFSFQYKDKLKDVEISGVAGA
jgi:hypothetical protein